MAQNLNSIARIVLLISSKMSELQNIIRNLILRNYNTFKIEFGMEKYLDMVTDTHKVVEDEVNFLASCEQYAGLREDFLKKVANRFNGFTPLSDHETYIFLVKSDDPYILAWLGKHIAQFFIKRC